MARQEAVRLAEIVQEKDSSGMGNGTRIRNGHKGSDLGFILKVELPTEFLNGLDTVCKRRRELRMIPSFLVM